MKITRVVSLDEIEEKQLRLIKELAELERLAQVMRWRATREATKMGLPTRMIAAAGKTSAAQVSRISTGKVRGAL